jgi:SARP family transcriptional regulator, regulator of embCAB operon
VALQLSLLGEFALSNDGSHTEVPWGSQRILALLALRGKAIRRAELANILWPDASDALCAKRLRTALWRLPPAVQLAIHTTTTEVGLRHSVTVDVSDATARAHRLILPEAVPEEDLDVESASVFSVELLPGWYDDWAIVEADAWHQLRLHALEALTNRLTALGRFADAVAIGTAAVAGDPLRESARAALIRAHLAEGNQSEAVRQYGAYAYMLDDELGLVPSDGLRALLLARIDYKNPPSA